MPTLRIQRFHEIRRFYEDSMDLTVPRGTKIIGADRHEQTLCLSCPDGPDVPHELVAIRLPEEGVTRLPEGTIENPLYLHPWMVWLRERTAGAKEESALPAPSLPTLLQDLPALARAQTAAWERWVQTLEQRQGVPSPAERLAWERLVPHWKDVPGDANDLPFTWVALHGGEGVPGDANTMYRLNNCRRAFTGDSLGCAVCGGRCPGYVKGLPA